MIYFADSSAIARAYLPDESDSAELRNLLLSGANTVLASQLATVEVPRALAAAARRARLDGEARRRVLAVVAGDLGREGAIEIVRLDAATALPRARELVIEHPLRTLDAIHLAVAEREGRSLAGGTPLLFVSRDSGQRAVAEAIGLEVD